MLKPLMISGGVLAGLYGWMFYISDRFAYGTSGESRPTWLFFTIAIVAFLVSLLAVRQAIRCTDNRSLLWCSLGVSVLFRLILLPSEPIQEIDIYRYLWDGRVVCAGVNPYRHSPRNVLDSINRTSRSPQLGKLTKIAEDSQTWHEVLKRVHFKELTTVYPPVSQAVFAVAAFISQDGDIDRLLLILKTLIVGFDVATCCLMFLLLRAIGMHGGWMIAYAWNPLVLKEFANSGHLDAIAIAMTMAAVLMLTPTRAVASPASKSIQQVILAAVFLAFGVGAKLYPLVLMPIIVVNLKRRSGMKEAVRFSVCFAVVACLVLMPWWMAQPADEVPTVYDLEGNVFDSATIESTDPKAGIARFMTHWKMNDFIFLIIGENLEPNAAAIPIEAWFVVVPDTWRWNLTNAIHKATGIEFSLVPFLLARLITALMFLAIAIWIARKKTGRDHREFAEGLFLTLAWFWLTLPTQNPWYWLWALPLLPMARSRVWWAMSGLVLAYYLRFWFKTTWPNETVLATPYSGATFFDYVVTWIEYAPWFVALAVSFWRPERADSANLTTDQGPQERLPQV